MHIREATTLSDLDEAVRIQREVWGVEDIEIAGRIQLKASQHAGGSVLVAEADDGTMAGFAYAFPALRNGEAFWHSDMLAVRKRFRGLKFGQALKWAQREHALRQGIGRITWTFDPMQAGNAYLNIEHLGARSNEYLENFYGITTSDLHHGLPTDRLLASWRLESPHVSARSGGERAAASSGVCKVPIPPRWNDLVKTDLALARAEQRRVREALEAGFAQGLVVQGFEKASSTYILGHERS